MSLCRAFELDRSFLTRLSRTTALSLALLMASGAGVQAEIVIVQGDDGANGADGVNLGEFRANQAANAWPPARAACIRSARP